MKFLIIIFNLLLVSCFSETEDKKDLISVDDGQVPAVELSLSYPDVDSNYEVNEGIDISASITNPGEVTSCVAHPSLPDGLTLNSETCHISGSTTEAVEQIYTITVTNNFDQSYSYDLDLHIISSETLEVFHDHIGLLFNVDHWDTETIYLPYTGGEALSCELRDAQNLPDLDLEDSDLCTCSDGNCSVNISEVRSLGFASFEFRVQNNNATSNWELVILNLVAYLTNFLAEEFETGEVFLEDYEVEPNHYSIEGLLANFDIFHLQGEAIHVNAYSDDPEVDVLIYCDDFVDSGCSLDLLGEFDDEVYINIEIYDGHSEMISPTQSIRFYK